MAELGKDAQRLRKTVLVILALGITVLFLVMIREFLMVLLLAALVAGASHPLYERLRTKLGGRPSLAAAITVALVFLLVLVPIIGLLGIVAAQAVELSQVAGPWVQRQLKEPTQFDDIVARYPELGQLAPYRDQIYAKLGELASHLGTFAFGAVTTVARETAAFFLMLFVLLYAVFFFLMDGRKALHKILFYLPLTPDDENLMLERFLSVSRATVKGTLVIGVIQGALGGVALWAAGIDAPVFWAAVMAVMSVLPGVGTALVWVPAVIYLVVTGRMLAASLLFAWCAAVVGSVDNFLRPWLVGKDTKMPDLLILLATLGGIVLFGALGLVVGPIVAALFVTVWDLYGKAFKDVLPAVDP